MPPLLFLKSVSKIYDGNITPSLFDFSLQINKGTTIAVMGESGSGKTTLLKLIAGLEDVSHGEIFFQGQKLLGPTDKLVAGISNIRLINQNLTLPPNQSIAQSIGYQLKHHQETYKSSRTRELLALFQLEEFGNKTSSQLSGGQRQRALFAWAIADEPDLLLMDEPLSHLDDMFKDYLYDQVFSILKKTKTTVIFATHQASEVYRLADQVVLMKNGLAIQKGTPEILYRKPETVDAAKLLGICQVLPARKFLKLILNQNLGASLDSIILRPHEVTLCPIESSFGIEVDVRKVTFMGAYYEVKVKVCKQAHTNYRPMLVVHSKGNPAFTGDKARLRFENIDWVKVK